MNPKWEIVNIANYGDTPPVRSNNFLVPFASSPIIVFLGGKDSTYTLTSSVSIFNTETAEFKNLQDTLID